MDGGIPVKRSENALNMTVKLFAAFNVNDQIKYRI